MNCKTQKRLRIMSCIMLVIGIVVGACTKFLPPTTSFPVDYLYGVSVGLITATLLVLLISYIRSRNPRLAKEDQIREKDERQQFISAASIKAAYSYCFYMLFVLFILDLFIPLTFHYMAMFLIISTAVVNLIASTYYERKY